VTPGRSRASWRSLLALALLTACDDYADRVVPDGRSPTAIEGALLYTELCVSCHGPDARGHIGPALRPWAGTRAALVAKIAADMPPLAPEACDATCAEAIAAWLLRPTTAPTQCDGTMSPPPRLRLLSRRELVATVRDLFDRAPPASACRRRTFSLTTGETPRAVVVAGDFNGWATTEAAGAWPLRRTEGGTWTGTFEVDEGTWQYKFVLDGATWVTDPGNPATTPDGYGGQNSVLIVDCRPPLPIVPTGDTLVASFPPEVRPEGFPFDTHAEAQTVTASHVEAWLEAAELLADHYVVELARRLPCADAGGPSCARELVTDVATRAFRRPLQDDERDRLAALVNAEPRFADGVRVALRVILTSPSFLYRSELGVPEGDVRRLDAYEIVNALSYTLWGTMPDAALFAAAAEGRVETPEGIAAEVERLLADPRAYDAIGAFGRAWLDVDRVLTADKRADLYPGFDAATRAALHAETGRFVAHVALADTGRFAELFTANYTFMDALTARHYGHAALDGDAPRRVATDPRRHAGVLGHASVLAATAHSDQTSPIKRGVFVRERLLCQVFGAPPPEAGGLPAVDPSATTRERFRQHTDNDACASCHRYIDDLGFGFEHFDPVGRWRDDDGGKAIDAHGELTDREGFGTGTTAPFDGLPALGALIADSRAARACFVTQVARYAWGDLVEDPCAVADLQARFEASGGDIRRLLVDVFRQPGFVERRAPESP